MKYTAKSLLSRIAGKIVTALIIAALLFGIYQLFFNEDFQKKYVPAGSSVSSVVDIVNVEKNSFEYKCEKIEKNFNNILNVDF